MARWFVYKFVGELRKVEIILRRYTDSHIKIDYSPTTVNVV